MIDVKEMTKRVQQVAGTTEDFSHPFYLKVKEILDAGDLDNFSKEKTITKLLRIEDSAASGFILDNFPRTLQDAESLEELHGGLNSFVHISYPERFIAQMEEVKVVCQDCGTVYYSQRVVDRENNIIQEKTLPDDGHCFSCGSNDIGHQTSDLEEQLNRYNEIKGPILDFYNTLVSHINHRDYLSTLI